MGWTTPIPEVKTKKFSPKMLEKIDLWTNSISLKVVDNDNDMGVYEAVFKYKGSLWQLRFCHSTETGYGSLDAGEDLTAIEVEEITRVVISYMPKTTWS